MSHEESSEKPGRLSAVTAAISGALVAALIGYLVFHAIRSNEPPAIVVETVPNANWSRNGVTYLAIDVRNEGDLSASDVQIQVQPEGNGSDIRRTSIDYLAGGETRRIYVAVPGTPAGAQKGVAGELRVLVVGFKES